MCDYQGHHFGANYPDACCIEGYLWDLDSGGMDEAGNTYLDIGGYSPCPQCNQKAYVKSMAGDLANDGYESFDQPLTTKQVKYPLKGFPSNQRRVGIRYWRQGRRDALREAMSQGDIE